MGHLPWVRKKAHRTGSVILYICRAAGSSSSIALASWPKVHWVIVRQVFVKSEVWGEELPPASRGDESSRVYDPASCAGRIRKKRRRGIGIASAGGVSFIISTTPLIDSTGNPLIVLAEPMKAWALKVTYDRYQ